MKRTGFKGIAILMVVSLMSTVIVPAVSAYDEPDQTWTQKDFTTQGGQTAGTTAYTAATIGHFEPAPYDPDQGTYLFNYRITAVGETRYNDDGSPRNACRVQSLRIQELTNKGHQAFWTSTDPKYIGCWPQTEGDPQYYAQIAYSISSMAIGAINGYAGFAISATELVCYMVSHCNQHTDGEKIWRTWDYNPDQTDVGHFFWWKDEIDAGQTVQFEVEDILYGPVFELVGVSKTITATAPPPEPQKMTEEERKEYGIKSLSVSEFKSIAPDLGIPTERVNELTKSGKPIYVAYNVSMQSVSNKIDKEQAIARILSTGNYTKEMLFATEN